MSRPGRLMKNSSLCSRRDLTGVRASSVGCVTSRKHQIMQRFLRTYKTQVPVIRKRIIMKRRLEGAVRADRDGRRRPINRTFTTATSSGVRCGQVSWGETGLRPIRIFVGLTWRCQLAKTRLFRISHVHIHEGGRWFNFSCVNTGHARARG
jgi:hypothetical protein